MDIGPTDHPKGLGTDCADKYFSFIYIGKNSVLPEITANTPMI
jgi:hypothetical protein